jgi:aldehyde:ferredoxin oxidoreductase
VDYYGYSGNILHVNLTTGDVTKEPLDLELAQKFIGGQGINYYLAWKHLKPGTAPLSPDNPMIIGAGPLLGTSAPGASKVAVTYKSPIIASKHENKHMVTSSVGGSKRFGLMLKCAGYDHVVITGKAKKPSYLKIIDDDVEICDASDLWGKKDAYETADDLVFKHKGTSGGCGVWTIGRAGENLVRWAHAFADKRGTLGRTGAGAILGSKNLKAVVTLGTKGVKVADSKRFMALVNQKRKYILNHPLFGQPYPPKGTYDMVPVYAEDLFDDTRTTRSGCVTCMGGEFWNHVIKEGRFAGCGMQGSIFIYVRLMGQQLGIKEGGDMMWFTDFITRNGLCIPTTCRMVHWVTWLYERGIISPKDTGGLELKRGDLDCYIALVNKIVNKEDIGAIMAEGWYPLFNTFGVDATEDFDDGISIAKGLDFIADARLFFGLTPGIFGNLVKARQVHTHQATHDPRAEDVYKNTNWPYLQKTFNDVKRNFKLMGTSQEEMDRVFTDKYFYTGRLEKHAEDTSAVYNSLGMCDISPYGLSAPTQDMPWCAELYETATGLQVTPEELKIRGDRVFNLEALFNAREGITRKDAKYPPIWVQNIKKHFIEPLPKKENYLHDWFGRLLNEDDLEKILDEYYDERGWDIKKGVPTKETLQKLGLDDL